MGIKGATKAEHLVLRWQKSANLRDCYLENAKVGKRPNLRVCGDANQSAFHDRGKSRLGGRVTHRSEGALPRPKGRMVAEW